jgi:hypothetical protein
MFGRSRALIVICSSDALSSWCCSSTAANDGKIGSAARAAPYVAKAVMNDTNTINVIAPGNQTPGVQQQTLKIRMPK